MKKIFKEAHKMTKKMVERYGVDYRTQFGLNLSYLFEIKGGKDEMKLETLEDVKELVKKEMDQVETEREFEITRFEMKEWKNYGKHRIYMNISINSKGNTARKNNGYLDILEDGTIKYFTTDVEYRRYNEDTMEAIENTISKIRKDIVKIVVA